MCCPLLFVLPSGRAVTKWGLVQHVRVSDTTDSVAGGNPILLAGDDSNPSLGVAALEEKEAVMGYGVLQPRFKNSEALGNMHVLGHLDKSQHEQLTDIIDSYLSLFSDTPSHTSLIEHDIDIGDTQPIKQGT